jgi:hypothetical protein
MNPKAENIQHITEQQIVAAEKIIEEATKSTSQCFWPDIVRVNAGRVTIEAIQTAIDRMARGGRLRFKEDGSEHAYEYILIKRGTS